MRADAPSAIATVNGAPPDAAADAGAADAGGYDEDNAAVLFAAPDLMTPSKNHSGDIDDDMHNHPVTKGDEYMNMFEIPEQPKQCDSSDDDSCILAYSHESVQRGDKTGQNNGKQVARILPVQDGGWALFLTKG